MWNRSEKCFGIRETRSENFDLRFFDGSRRSQSIVNKIENKSIVFSGKNYLSHEFSREK